MIRKSILGLALVTLVSSNSFADELYKARIIEHKEWTTGNAKVVFNSGKALNTHLNKPIAKKEYSFANVQSWAFPTLGTTGMPVSIPGANSIFIANESQKNQHYTYTFSVCAEDSDHSSICGYFYDHVELSPGGYVFISKEPQLEITFKNAAEYMTSIASNVMKDEGDGVWTPQSDSTSHAIVKITNSIN